LSIEASVAINRICHMIALSQDGKVEEAVDNLVISVLAVDPSLHLSTADQFRQAIDSYFSVNLRLELLQDSINRNVAATRLLLGGPDAYYRLSPAAAAAAERSIEEASQLESIVRSEWWAALPTLYHDLGPDAEQALWSALRRYLAKAFLRHGAETAFLLDPQQSGVDPVGGSLSQFLSTVIRESCPDVPADIAEEALRGFFRFSSPSRTRYLAQLLDGTFSIFALSIDEATAGYLRSQLTPLKLFLDTNFIFGIRNHSGRDSWMLDDVAQRLRPGPDCCR